MNKNGWLKVLGMVVGLAGLGINALANWVDQKQTEELVEEKINEALAKREEESE